MKRSILFLILLVVTSFGASVNLVRGGGGYQFEVNYPTYVVKNITVNEVLEDGTPIAQTFTSVEIPGLHANGEFGAPKIQSDQFQIAVENDNVGVDYVILDADTLELVNALFPKQVELPTSMAGQKPAYFAYDVASYGAAADAPVEVGHFYTYRTQRAATVTINPMQYNAAKNQLIIIKKMGVTLKMDAVRSLKTGRSNLFENVMRNKFQNLKGIDGRAVSAEKFRGSEDYLIIATSAYIDNADLKRLIDYRSNQYNVEVVNASEVPQQTKDGFKSYIRDKMPTFCLLVGSYRDFPTHSHTYGGVTCKSVSYYVCAGGSTPDPDISLGLFFVSSATDIKNIVDKILATEEKNDDNPKVFVGVGGNKQNMGQLKPDHCDRVVEQMYNDFFKPMDFDYVSSYSVNSGATTCVNACNEGARVFNYNGHGFENGWQYGWGNTNISSLTNDVYPFVLSCACLTGTFDKGCMGEKFAYGPQGAVAFMGAYQNSFGGQHGLNYGFCEALTDLNITRVGPAFVNGQNCWTSPTSTVLMPSDNGNMTMMQYQYHLFGDPATEVMTSISTDPYVKVSSPNGGEKWGQYSTRTIKWGSNQKDEKVTVELYKDGELVETLGESIANSGSLEWQIPEDFPVGTGYSVLVKTVTGDALEDESDATFEIVPEEIVNVFPYIQDFEKFEPTGGFNPGDGKEGFDTAAISMEGWEQQDDDDLEMLSITGGTPSFLYYYPDTKGTGTGGDHTTGDGIYLYTESSAGNDNMEACFKSPVFDMSLLSNATVEYWLHMRSDSARSGEHHFDICVDGEWTKDIVVEKQALGEDWVKKTVELEQYVKGGKRVQFCFRTVTGPAWDSDICLDDFKITGDQVSVLWNSAVQNKFAVTANAGALKYTLPQSVNGKRVSVKLYNVQGQIIETLFDGVAKAGSMQLNLDKNVLGAGYYICQLKGEGFVETTNLIIK